MGHPLPPSPRSRGCSAISYTRVPPGCRRPGLGLESPGQSATWRILLRFTEAGTGGCGEVDRVARLIARKPSPKPEIVRRVTGVRSVAYRIRVSPYLVDCGLASNAPKCT